MSNNINLHAIFEKIYRQQYLNEQTNTVPENQQIDNRLWSERYMMPYDYVSLERYHIQNIQDSWRDTFEDEEIPVKKSIVPKELFMMDE